MAILHELDLPEGSWYSPAENLESLAPRAESTDLVVTVGGDGTILRAVRFTAPAGIPIVGINMGRLGFMTELTVDEAMPKLPGYLCGNHRIDARNMLQATVTQGGSTISQGPYHALNDFVVARGAASRVVSIAGVIDGAQVSTFRADGLILSTANRQARDPTGVAADTGPGIRCGCVKKKDRGGPHGPDGLALFFLFLRPKWRFLFSSRGTRPPCSA
ncbi:NAD kinase [Geodia barretti]|uniref:NAD(+) kinase n=1 Tax=Geodia barretti TaxID=519541 RepID=A0AA35XBF6_GEOBA|nr:NAD kinase [Geodia barretti]